MCILTGIHQTGGVYDIQHIWLQTTYLVAVGGYTHIGWSTHIQLSLCIISPTKTISTSVVVAPVVSQDRPSSHNATKVKGKRKHRNSYAIVMTPCAWYEYICICVLKGWEMGQLEQCRKILELPKTSLNIKWHYFIWLISIITYFYKQLTQHRNILNNVMTLSIQEHSDLIQLMVLQCGTGP